MATTKAKVRTKVNVHISLFDWRVSMALGFLAGIVVVSAPSYIGAILLFGLILGVIKLVEIGRI